MTTVLTSRFVTHDGRFVARLILLANRFGCEMNEVHVTRDAQTFTAEIAFTGGAEALRRLDAQIGKLLDYEKEIA